MSIDRFGDIDALYVHAAYLDRYGSEIAAAAPTGKAGGRWATDGWRLELHSFDAHILPIDLLRASFLGWPI